MSERETPYEWQVSFEGPPFIVIDWAGRRHEFPTRPAAFEYVDRDRRMFRDASNSAKADMVTSIQEAFEGPDGEHEQTAGTAGEAGQVAEGVGGTGNRRSRRRDARAAYSKKASGRGRRSS